MCVLHVSLTSSRHARQACESAVDIGVYRIPMRHHEFILQDVAQIKGYLIDELDRSHCEKSSADALFAAFEKVNDDLCDDDESYNTVLEEHEGLMLLAKYHVLVRMNKHAVDAQGQRLLAWHRGWQDLMKHFEDLIESDAALQRLGMEPWR